LKNQTPAKPIQANEPRCLALGTREAHTQPLFLKEHRDEDTGFLGPLQLSHQSYPTEPTLELVGQHQSRFSKDMRGNGFDWPTVMVAAD